MTESTLVEQLGLFAIGLGIGSFLTIARVAQTILPIALQVGLVAISRSALFVGLFSLSPSKDYQPNSKKDYATDKKLRMVIPNYPNQCTSYYQNYAKPFQFHMFLSPLRHIICYLKRTVNRKRTESRFEDSLRLCLQIRWPGYSSGKGAVRQVIVTVALARSVKNLKLMRLLLQTLINHGRNPNKQQYAPS